MPVSHLYSYTARKLLVKMITIEFLLKKYYVVEKNRIIELYYIVHVKLMPSLLYFLSWHTD